MGLNLSRRVLNKLKGKPMLSKTLNYHVNSILSMSAHMHNVASEMKEDVDGRILPCEDDLQEMERYIDLIRRFISDARTEIEINAVEI